jgi:hypothetical protein
MKTRKDMDKGTSIMNVYDVMLAESRDRQTIDMTGKWPQIGWTWLLGWTQHQEFTLSELKSRAILSTTKSSDVNASDDS